MRQAYTDSVDIQPDVAAAGSAEPDYSGTATVSSVPCRIMSISGDSTYRGRMLEARVSHVVEMQYIDGVTPTSRLKVVGGPLVDRYLNIVSSRIVDGHGRARKLEVYCEERAGR